jgi:hypothetical protein
MRENFAKEREIVRAYEEMKIQQRSEIQRLTAVTNHLQQMAFNASDTFKKATF